MQQAWTRGRTTLWEEWDEPQDDVGNWPDADLPQRQLLGRLLGVERTRYAQRELFRV
jgi:hypothetical protein